MRPVTLKHKKYIQNTTEHWSAERHDICPTAVVPGKQRFTGSQIITTSDIKFGGPGRRKRNCWSFMILIKNKVIANMYIEFVNGAEK